MPNATTGAILDNARAALPGVGDDVILQALFNVCDDIAREALRVTAPTNVDGDPATWLPSAEWVPNFQPLLAGTLASLYGQFGKPYFQPDLAKANLDRYLAYRTLARATAAGATAAVDTVPERLVSAVRAQISGIRDEAVLLEIYGVVNRLRVEAFRQTALTGVSNDPTTWLTATEYQQAYLAILYGTLSRLYGQTNMAWLSLEQQTAQQTLYEQEFNSIRASTAGATTAVDTISERLVSAVRAQIPEIRDEAIQLEMFGVVNNLLDEAYKLPPLAGTDTAMASWLTVSQYEESYQALLYGTLAGLYGQASMPWANPDQAKAQAENYLIELNAIRTTAAGVTTAVDTIPERVVSSVRAQIPLIRDEAVQLVMFGVVNDIRDEAYRLPALAPGAAITSWLSTAQYEQSYQAVLHGTLSRLYGQPGTAWLNADLFKAEDELYRQELNAVRATEAGATTVVDTIPERIVSQVRAQIPLIRDTVAQLAMFDVVNNVRVEAYRYAPLTGASTSPTTWLTATEYERSYTAILHGVLSRLYGQVGAAWVNPDLSKAEFDLYQRDLQQIRVFEAGSTASTGNQSNRIVSEVRAQIPLARDEAIKLELYAAVDCIRREALRIGGLTTTASDPNTWLTTAQWTQCYQAALHGTLYRLFLQAGSPWYSDPAYQAHYAYYNKELLQVRAEEAGSSAATDTIVERLISSLRAEIPIARDEALKLAMFGTVDRLRAEVYRLAPLTGTNTDPTTWFNTAQYEQAFLAIQHGTLYRLYAQAGQPWFNNEMSQVQLGLYQTETISLRMVLAGAVTAVDTIPERIVSTVRAQIQLVRDEAVKLEMFNVIQKIRDEAYQSDPLKGVDTDYTTWLTEAQYEESYLAILYGTLSRLYGQSNMPWFNLDLYGSNNVLFLAELDLVRSGNIDAGSGIDGILSEARTYLPGASQEVMQIELRRCMDEFFKITQVWQGDVDLKVKPGKLVYELDSSDCPGVGQIVRLILLTNSNDIPVSYYSMQNIPELVLTCEPSQKETFTARLCFSLLSPSTCSCAQLTNQCGTSWGVPNWILVRWNEVFFDGLLWRMMMQPAKPYTNTEIGLFHGQRWREGLADARGAAKQQNIYDGQRWRFPAFA